MDGFQGVRLPRIATTAAKGWRLRQRRGPTHGDRTQHRSRAPGASTEGKQSPALHAGPGGSGRGDRTDAEGRQHRPGATAGEKPEFGADIGFGSHVVRIIEAPRQF